MTGTVSIMSRHFAALCIPVVLVSVFVLLTPACADFYHKYNDDFAMNYLKSMLCLSGQGCEIGLRIYDSCKLHLWRDYCIEEGHKLFNSEYFDKNKCTIIIGIPFMTNLGRANLKIIIKALVSHCEYNIVVLNNSKHTHVYFWQYTAAVESSFEDAQRFATVLHEAMKKKLLKEDCIIGVGYSLAANTLGHVCRRLPQKCKTIYAIDPAGHGFRPPSLSVQESLFLVSQQDACHVVFLLCTQDMLGTKHHLGHVNIILNNGHIQPECRKGVINKTFAMASQYCSHSYCNKLFARAIETKDSCVAYKIDITPTGAVNILPDKPGYSLSLKPDPRYFSDKCEIRTPDKFSLYTLKGAVCGKKKT